MRETRTDTNFWQQYKAIAAGKNKMQHAILWTFFVVAAALMWMAKKLHLTYNAINVLAYYWLVPATWTFMIDWKMDCHLVTPLFDVFCPILTIHIISICR